VGKKGLDEFIETLTEKMNSYTAKLVQMNATALSPLSLLPCNPASPLLTRCCRTASAALPTLPPCSRC
jgi:hypothetical protein